MARKKQPQGSDSKRTRIISPSFWDGPTGRQMRDAGPVVLTIGLYLITSPHSNAIGLYQIWPETISRDTGIKTAQVGSALDRLAAIGFIQRDEAAGLVWVVKMARWQIAGGVGARDNRAKWVAKMAETARGSALRDAFLSHYAAKWPGFHAFLSAGEGVPEGVPKGVPKDVTQPVKKERKSTVKLGDSSALRAERGGAATPTSPDPGPPPPAQEETVPAPTVEPGTADAVLRRLRARESAAAPPAGSHVRYHKDGAGQTRGATIHGTGAGRLAPGPWRMSADVEAAIRGRLLDSVPGYTHPSPPRLQGDEDCHGADTEDLCAAMVKAWKAVVKHKTGDDYKGRVAAKRKDGMAEAARILRAEGMSPWVFFAWAWDNEVERSRKAPQFYTVASTTFVGRMISRALTKAPRYDRIAVNGEARSELLDTRAAALQHLRRERPMSADEARTIADHALPEDRYNDLLIRVRRECVAAKRRDIASLDRGIWIWG